MTRKKNVGGRPSKITPARLKKLEDAFLMGCSDREACLVADISTTALYTYQTAHPQFKERKEALKSNPLMLAKKTILEGITGGDLVTARWMVEKHEGKATQPVNMSGNLGITHEEALKQLE